MSKVQPVNPLLWGKFYHCHRFPEVLNSPILTLVKGIPEKGVGRRYKIKGNFKVLYAFCLQGYFQACVPSQIFSLIYKFQF